VQTALYKTFTHWDRLRSPRAAEAYTRTTMVRLAARWGRRRWLGERPTADVGRAVALPDVADAAVLGLDLRAALCRLPPSQRAAIVLRYFDDLSEADTAAVLGCSVGTVKSRVSRGLAGLRATGLLGDSAATGGSAGRGGALSVGDPSVDDSSVGDRSEVHRG
jgi:RNA polymerase sigma-70 factor (sigma-E family)